MATDPTQLAESLEAAISAATDPKYRDALKVQAEALAVNAANADAVAMAFGSLQREQRELLDSTKSLERSTERLIRTLTGVEERADGVTAAFGKMLYEGKGFNAALTTMGKTITKTMTPMNVGIATFKKFAEASVILTMEIDNAATAFAKATGTGNKYKDVIRKVEFQNRRFGVSAAEAGSANAALLGGFSQFLIIGGDHQAVLAGNVAQFDKLGVSAATTTKFLQGYTRTTGRTWKQGVQLQKVVMGVASAFDDDLNMAMEAAAEVMPQLAVYGDNLTGVFKNLYAASKRTGMGMSEIVALSDRFDTFEAAADAAGRLNAVLGQMGAAPIIDTMQILEETDPAKRMQLFSNAIKQSGVEFETLGKYQQDAIANAMGLSTAEMRRIILQEKQTSKLDAAMQNAGLTQKKLNELMEDGRDLMTEMKIMALQFAASMQAPLQDFKNVIGGISDLLDKLPPGMKATLGTAAAVIASGGMVILLAKLLTKGTRMDPMVVTQSADLKSLFSKFSSGGPTGNLLAPGVQGFGGQVGASTLATKLAPLAPIGLALGGLAIGLAGVGIGLKRLATEKESQKKNRKWGMGLGTVAGIGLLAASGFLTGGAAPLAIAGALAAAGGTGYAVGGEIGGSETVASMTGAQHGAYANLAGKWGPSMVQNQTTVPTKPGAGNLAVGENQTKEAIIPLNEEGRRGIGMEENNKLLAEQNTKLDAVIAAVSQQQIVLVKGELEKAGFMNRFAKVTGPWG